MISIILALGGLIGAFIYLIMHYKIFTKERPLSLKCALYGQVVVVGIFFFLIGMLISQFSCAIFAYCCPNFEYTISVDFEQNLILSQAGTAVSLTDNWFEYYNEEGIIKIDTRMTYVEYTEDTPKLVRYTVRPVNEVVNWLFNPHFYYYIFYVPEGGVALPRSPY